jgi:DNA-binding FrmR family transcriptional regulator
MDHCTCDSQKAMNLLKTARGQIDGVIRMIEEDRYCVDVSRQVLAVSALIKKANLVILRQHMDTCVKEAVETDKSEEKLDEIMEILSTYMG